MNLARFRPSQQKSAQVRFRCAVYSQLCAEVGQSVGTDSTQEGNSMEAIGLLVTLEARAGKETDAEAFLKSAQPLARDEQGTLKWYAIKLGRGGSGSSTPLRIKRAAMPTWVALLPRHWGRGPLSYLRCLRRCKKWKLSQAHPSRVECEVATNGC